MCWNAALQESGYDLPYSNRTEDREKRSIRATEAWFRRTLLGQTGDTGSEAKFVAMTHAPANPEPRTVAGPDAGATFQAEENAATARERRVGRLRLLWNRRKVLFRTAVAGLVLATALAFVMPRYYQATTQLMPPDSQSSSGMAMMAALTARAGNGLAGYMGDFLGVKSTGALFVGILRSRAVQEQLVNRFDLRKVYRARLVQDAEKILAEHTTVSEDRKSGIITITVTDGSPQRAAAIAAAYAEELDHLVNEVSTSAAHRERVFLEERLKTVKQDLDAAAEQFGQFASKNAAIDIKEQSRAMVEAAATLQGQLIAAQSELEMLKQIYTDQNVRVRAAAARIAELRRQLEKLGGKDMTSTTGFAASGDALYPSIRKLPLLGVTYADLFRRTKIQETVFETLTQQYELAKVQEVRETPSVKVLDPARVPEKKSFPPRLLIVFLGTFLCFTFAVVWVLGSARWEETDPQDPGKVLAQEVFATVKARMPWAMQNGSRLRSVTSRVRSQFRRWHPEPGDRS